MISTMYNIESKFECGFESGTESESEKLQVKIVVKSCQKKFGSIIYISEKSFDKKNFVPKFFLGQINC